MAAPTAGYHEHVTGEDRRAVVLGGVGFLGTRLCELLLDRGMHVMCLDNEATGSIGNIGHLGDDACFEFDYVDVTVPFDVPGDVDVVFHLASPASPAQYLAMPVETMRAGSLGTMHGLDLARRKGARFLLASTSEVYGDPLVHPQREEYWGNANPVGPRAVYDESKRFGEALTTAYRTAHRVDTAIARIFNTYGPRMCTEDGRVVPTFIGQALAGEPLTVAGDGMQTRSLCYVDDTVRGMLALAFSDHAGPVNLGNPDEISVYDLARQIIELTGSGSPIGFVPLPEDDPAKRRPDIELARQLLGWQPRTSRDEGLARTIAWMRSARDSTTVSGTEAHVG